MITGTVEGDQARFYIDGVLMDERTLSHPFSYGNSEPLTLGCHYYSGVPSYWAYTLLGVMDEVRIYSRVFTPQEVMQLYNYSEGNLSGLFSVSETTQVNFSKGNLQYQASTNTWRFAENQWDCVGADNANISETYDGWIDLFGWGTSGYDHGANAYQPWSTSQYNSDYWAYGDSGASLSDYTGQADWGYNAISNGGNTENCGWRTLKKDEWVYLFNSRTTPSGIRYAKATVNGVTGIILLPDDWSTTYYSLSNTNVGSAAWTSNTISASDWTNNLEKHGAVFLPTSGNRDGANAPSSGFVSSWSSDYYAGNSKDAYVVYIPGDSVYPDAQGQRSTGNPVRLVRNAE